MTNPTRVLVSCVAMTLGTLAAGEIFPAGRTLYLLTEDGGLVVTTLARPDLFGEPVPIIGVFAGETLVALDVRPQNQALYGLGVDAASDTAHLYCITPENGIATVIGASPIAFVDGGGFPLGLPGAGWDMDFNPAADRLRVVASTGLSFRVNPNTGLAVDGDFGGSVTAGTNPDGYINGAATGADGAAYTNNRPNNGSITTLYTLSAQTNSLYIQTPPNSGTQTSQKQIKVNGAVVNFSGAGGFDIPPGVDAASSNSPVAGTAYAVLKSLAGSNLYSIELGSGNATPMGGLLVRSFAIRTRLGAAMALTADGGLLMRFDPATPGTVTTQALGLPSAGEILVGIDGRPATGQLMGLGVNATANNATLYLIDPQTGVLSAIGAPGGISFLDGVGSPVDFPDPATTGYGFDFNPNADRIRVVTGSGLNFRLNPSTGAAVDGNFGLPAIFTGTNTDGFINGSTTSVTHAAYTNNHAGTPVTTLYTLDSSINAIFIQNPANSGTQVSGNTVTLGGSPLDFTSVGGFDICREVVAPASGSAAAGKGFAALTVGGVSGFYKIRLRDGTAEYAGAIGAGVTSISGLVVWAGSPGTEYGFLAESTPGAACSFETSTDLTPLSWSPLAETFTAGGDWLFTVVAGPEPGEPRRFWRMRELTP